MSTKITITEALAEVPTIVKRIDKKREFIRSCLYRQSAIRDQHEKDGGSATVIQQEMQGIRDLCDRLVNIRAAIAEANTVNTITIGKVTRPIADWLTWRREVAPGEKAFLNGLAAHLNQLHQQANQKGVIVTEKDAGFSPDFVVNINEKALAESIEGLEVVLGTLDGQLSLKNATITITVD